MRKLLFLILLVPVLLFGQTKERVPFETPIFKGEYSEVYEQPLWLEYTIKCPNGSASRTGMDFYRDTKIWTSDNKDYERIMIKRLLHAGVFFLIPNILNSLPFQ